MAQLQFTFTYTAADAAIAQALTDAYNAQGASNPTWVNITVKQYLSRLFKQSWRDEALRYLRQKQDADREAETTRLESGTTVV